MKNRKGFTLVEVVISMAIGVVALLIGGSMIISSTDFYSSTIEVDMDKRTISSIVDYIRSEIAYSTDVKILSPTGEGASSLISDEHWNYLYVQDGRLYKNDVQVFDDGFYSQRDFYLTVKGDFGNEARVDLVYSMKNGTKQTYSYSDTIMFLNLSVSDELLSQGLYTEAQVEVSPLSHYIFYSRTKTVSSNSGEEEMREGEGTVADQLSLVNPLNNRGKWDSSVPQRYFYKYDFVYYDGYWWMNLNQSNYYDYPGAIGAGSWWKRISAEWYVLSAYQKGDVVLHKGAYYECIQDLINKGTNESTLSKYEPGIGNDAPVYWKQISKNAAIAKGNNASHVNVTSPALSLYNQTIIKKVNGIDLSQVKEYNSSLNPTIPAVKDTVSASNIYKITEKDPVTQQPYVRYFIKYANYNGNPSEPGQLNSEGKASWQEISIDFNENSVYLMDDVIYFDKNSKSYGNGNNSVTIGLYKCTHFHAYDNQRPTISSQNDNPWVKLK